MTTIAESVWYREPTWADLPDIQVVDGAAFRDSYPFFVFRQLLDAHSSRCVVAVEPGDDEDNVVGYALTIMGEGARAWLISLAVSPDRRGRGYGHGLLQRSVQVCLERGDVEEVWLTVDPQNVSAYTLFADFGFVLREHDEQYFGDKEPRDVLIFKLHRLSGEPPVGASENGWTELRSAGHDAGSAGRARSLHAPAIAESATALHPDTRSARDLQSGLVV
ncbi:GNAT family N-acetyltransferase [Nocardia salmonicida]|uniref:GNAT family N-acetyltransferase n=1 Tax=Nocardia salmonicida TaxID=53431 RepID=UPI0033EAF1CC